MFLDDTKINNRQQKSEYQGFRKCHDVVNASRINIYIHIYMGSDLVETSVEDFFYFRALKHHGLGVALVIMVQKRQGLVTVWD